MPQEEQSSAVKLINTTGYTIVVIDRISGKKLLTLPPDALFLYVHCVHCIEPKWNVAGVDISVNDRKHYANEDVLPPEKEGIIYIVRSSVFRALRPTRHDLAFMIDYFPPEEDLSDDIIRYTQGFQIESYFNATTR